MPTLSAMFQLFDGYSSKIDQMMRRTDAAMTKMLGASKAADGLNDSMKKTGAGADGATKKQKHYNDTLGDTAAKAQRANSSLKTLLGTVASLAAVKKGMDLTDTYTNTNARLGMITSSPEEQAALRQDVFAAANRSRGDYTEMANAASKLRMLASDTFGGETGNQEAVAFTELLTKSLKVSGAGTAEQNSAFLQLTQAMTAGKLQGDEFRSVMENAPMVADAIATYMGKSKAELRKLSSEGKITADIIKGAMFSAADDINSKFESMPPTFADKWNQIKNAGMQAFGDVFMKANEMLNSDMGQAAISNLITLVNMAAGAFDAFLDGVGWVGSNMEWLSLILFGAVAGFSVYQIAVGVAAAKQWLLNSAMLASPIFWMVAGVTLLVVAIYKLASYIAATTGLSVSGFGLIAGSINVVIQFFWNLLLAAGSVALGIGLAVAALGANIVIAFGNSTKNVKAFFYDLLSSALTVISRIAAELNKLPFIDFDYSGVVSAADQYASKAAAERSEKMEYVSISESFKLGAGALGAFKDGWVQDAFNSGASFGDGVADKVSGLFSGFAPDSAGVGNEFDFGSLASEPYGGTGNPATVKGTGQGGAVKVENEEDIERMRKLAERDYVARISQNTLAPNIRVEFSGPITKEADTDGVMSRVVEQLKDVIATAPEGVPA